MAYDPAKDAHDSFYAAIEAKKARGDKHDWENRPWKRREVIGDCTLLLGDCLEILPSLGKVDAVVTDPPFGTTQCGWDVVLPFDRMWAALGEVTGKGTPVVLFGCEPFSSLLRTSNLRRFKYDWIWNKPKGTGFLNAKKQPLRGHETISVFCDGQSRYFPQMSSGHARKQSFRGKHLQTDVYGHMAGDYSYDSTERYPRSVLTFSSDTQNSSDHPTQKPVALVEYLVRTYASEGASVLDFTMGSGTAGIACLRSGRRFIGIESDPSHFATACRRIREEHSKPALFNSPLVAPEPVQQPLFGGEAA